MRANKKQERIVNLFILFLLALALVSSSYAFTGTAPGIETTAGIGTIGDIAQNSSQINYANNFGSMSPVGFYEGIYSGYFGFIFSETEEPEDNTTIHINLISPMNKAGSRSETITFRISATGAPISNCALIINGTEETFVYYPSNGIIEFVSFLPVGKYNWTVSCYDLLDQKYNSSARDITIMRATDFDGMTTNFNNTDVSNIINLTIAKSGSGKIIFSVSTDLSEGFSLNGNIIFGSNSIFVNSSALSMLNKSAMLTIYNVNLQHPVILRDGALCTECSILSYNQNLTFNVSHFSNYSLSENTLLDIWDTTDTETKYANELISFYANYTNRTSGQAITGANCNITFDDTGTLQMIYESQLYNYNRTFSGYGVYYYNISCDGTLSGFAVLNSRDYVSITLQNGPMGANVTLITNERGNVTVSPGTQTAQSGNVTLINADTKMITPSWQGYFGNVTGQIILQNPDGDKLYDWTMTAPTGEVYATRAMDVNFATVNCSTDLHIAQEQNFIGHTYESADSVNNTFRNNNHPAFQVGIVNISANACKSTNIYINSSSQSNSFYETLLSDEADNIIYTSIIDPEKAGFDKNKHDFQMLVGENGHAGDAEVTTYYFFVELS